MQRKVNQIYPSGFTLDYTDPNTGIELPDAWAQIRYIVYTPEFNCSVLCDIYKDQEAYESGSAAVFQNIAPQVLYDDMYWNTYFDPSVMNQEDCNIQAMALEYLQVMI